MKMSVCLISYSSFDLPYSYEQESNKIIQVSIALEIDTIGEANVYIVTYFIPLTQKQWEDMNFPIL